MHLIKGSSLADRRVFLRIAGNRKIRGAGNARASRSVICRSEIEISKRVHFSIRTRRRTPVFFYEGKALARVSLPNFYRIIARITLSSLRRSPIVSFIISCALSPKRSQNRITWSEDFRKFFSYFSWREFCETCADPQIRISPEDVAASFLISLLELFPLVSRKMLIKFARNSYVVLSFFRKVTRASKATEGHSVS